MTSDTPEKSAERPLECSECKKHITTLYTVVERGSVSHTVMCASCPQLERRLQGTATHEVSAGDKTAIQIICPGCGTSPMQVRSGMPLGCSQCYDTFYEHILNDLINSEKVPIALVQVKKGAFLHTGRAIGETAEISPTLQLQALNEALAETLNREDYEQAAYLRDQIKQLTENSHDGQ